MQIDNGDDNDDHGDGGDDDGGDCSREMTVLSLA